MLQERVRAVLAAVKTNAGRLSDELGRSHNYVHGILDGKNQNPDDSFFEYLHIRYNVNIEWLRYGVGEMFGSDGMKNDYPAAMLVKKISALSPQHKVLMTEVVEALYLKEEAERKTEQSKPE